MLLGSFQANINGQTITIFESNKVRALLAYLAVEGQRPHPRDTLAGLLWPGYTNQSAMSNLRHTLANLRQAIQDSQSQPSFLLITREVIQINPASCINIDFSTCVEISQSLTDSSYPQSAIASIETAVSLYRGPFLEGFSSDSSEFEEWMLTQRERINHLVLDAIHFLAIYYEKAGDIEKTITRARQALALEPWDEEAHRLVMRSLAARGQRSAALGQYETCRHLLEQELRVQPSAKTQELFEDIRRGTIGAADRQPEPVETNASDRSNLPAQLTRFIGREQEIVEIQGKLKSGTDRLLTLTGSGGSSKPYRDPAPLPRGIVTFLFTDIEGSTPLWELQPEAMRESLAQHHVFLRQAIESRAGVVCQIIGDAFLGAFRLASDGLAAALDAQRLLQGAAWNATGPLRVRMGLHTGPAEPDPKGDAPYAVCHTLNRGSRVMSAAHGGQVLCSQETADLTTRDLPADVSLRDLGEHYMKGMSIPEHLYQVCAADLPVDFPALANALNHPNNLPAQLTSFIGREQEIIEIQGILKSGTNRLLTLTGSGGTGKTRLALRAAEGLMDEFEDGVYLVELAPLSDPALLPQACIQSLHLGQQANINPQNILINFIGNQHILFILDNCEHITQACASLVTSILKNCPRLQILATSRELLSVPGESLFHVPPLACPNPQNLPGLEELMQFSAVHLFVERAKQVLPGFLLRAETAAAVSQICLRLDGIPLALELVAGRLRLLSIEQIAARLDHTFRLLTGGSRAVLPRHQTLKATIDWSYDLLAPQERMLLLRLSTFAGGWSLEAAEVVCADNPNQPYEIAGLQRIETIEVLDLLGQLVDKSLVVTELGRSETRYHMLETIRQYSRDRLLEVGGSQDARDRHLAYFSSLSGKVEPSLRGKEALKWLDYLEVELDNLRVAMEWSLDRKVEQGLQIAADLMWFAHNRGLFSETAEWNERLLAAEQLTRGSAPLKAERALQRARALRVLAYTALHANYLSPEKRLQLLKGSIDILRSLVPLERRELGISLFYSAFYGNLEGECGENLIEAEVMLRQQHEYLYLSELYFYLCLNELAKGDHAKVRAYANESLGLARQVQDQDAMSSRLWILGFMAMYAGNYPEAELLFHEADENERKAEVLWIVPGLYLAQLALARGEYPEAARLAEKALANERTMKYRRTAIGATSLLIQIFWSQGLNEKVVDLANDTNLESPSNSWRAALYLGRTAMTRGDLAQAAALIHQSINILLNPLDPYVGLNHLDAVERWAILEGVAALFCQQGRYDQAAKILGSTDKIYQSYAPGLAPRERYEHNNTLVAIQSGLKEEVLRAFWAKGLELSLDQAIMDAFQAFEHPDQRGN